MDGHHNNDWDLFAVVRSCRNNNGNSSSSSNSNAQDGNPHHCFINGEQLSNAETRHGEFPNLLPERRYFGLDEVLDRFINRKQQEEEMTPQIDNKDESPQITLVSPTLTPKVQHGKSGSAKEVTVVEVAVEKVEEWDGWLWRKYGKKKVCDSPHTKSYYRCSFEGHKCPAKKHIQQSQRDENKFIVTYRGQHNHFPPVPSNTTKRRKRNNAPPASP